MTDAEWDMLAWIALYSFAPIVILAVGWFLFNRQQRMDTDKQMMDMIRADLKGSKMKKQNGFTLIELIIVIAIVMILLAVAVPAVNGKKGEVYHKCVDGKDMVKPSGVKTNWVFNVDMNGKPMPCHE